MTLVLSKFKSKFEEFVDPLFWLTQNIDRIVESRQENNVNSNKTTEMLVILFHLFFLDNSQRFHAIVNRS